MREGDVEREREGGKARLFTHSLTPPLLPLFLPPSFPFQVDELQRSLAASGPEAAQCIELSPSAEKLRLVVRACTNGQWEDENAPMEDFNLLCPEDFIIRSNDNVTPQRLRRNKDVQREMFTHPYYRTFEYKALNDFNFFYQRFRISFR